MVQILLTLICQQKPQKFACRYVVIVTLWYFIHSKFLCIIYFLTNSHSFIVYRVQTERKEKLSKTGRFIFQLLNTYFNRSYIFFKDMLSTEYTFCVTFRVVTKYNNYENSCIEIKKKIVLFDVNIDLSLSWKSYFCLTQHLFNAQWNLSVGWSVSEERWTWKGNRVVL